MTDPTFSQSVLDWFDQHGRKTLPWQQNKSAYNTWISEIMLQQTQVATVIPFYERFMERLPTVDALASAEIDEVLHLWTGLGYYARARNLHKCAQQVMERFDGDFPTDPAQLETLPGIGRSTAGAIASIAGGVRAPILDGNVKRVLARQIALEEWPGTTSALKLLWDEAERRTPHQRVGDYTQAMMDLGATLCARSRPSCERCPVQQFCQAHTQGRAAELPTPKPKKEKPIKQTTMLLIRKGSDFWLQQRPPTGIWGGLWSFPETPDLRDLPWATELKKEQVQALQPLRHTFSHYHLDISPVLIRADDFQTNAQSVMEEQPGLWYNTDNPPEVGLAAPVKKLLTALSSSLKGDLFNE